MRLIRQRIEKRDGSGTATLLPEESEDMVFHKLVNYVEFSRKTNNERTSIYSSL